MPYLSGGAMRHVLGPLTPGNFHLFASYARPGERGAQEIAVLIEGTGLNSGPDELFHKLPAHILNEHLKGEECLVRGDPGKDWGPEGAQGALSHTNSHRRSEQAMLAFLLLCRIHH